MSEFDTKTTTITWKDYVLPPLHPEGPGFVAVFFVATLILYWIWRPLGVIGFFLTVWCFYFFRDPDRLTPVRQGLVVSPADGVIQAIGPAVPPPELGMDPTPVPRISVFMSVFNCHVNRAPVAGTIVKEQYVPGRFLNATLDKASTDNERQALYLRTADGQALGVVQIAGLVARRIRCDVRAGQQLVTGQRFGMIRFGSRVDVFLPAGVAPLVCVGQQAVAGETVFADLASSESARQAEVR